MTPEQIVSATARAAGLPEAAIKGPSRAPRLTQWRLAGYLAARLAGLSTPAIGHAFGGRDHTTILSGERRAKASATMSMFAADILREAETDEAVRLDAWARDSLVFRSARAGAVFVRHVQNWGVDYGRDCP